MNQESKFIKTRLAWFKYARKSQNIAKTCRYYGISQSKYYFWLKRFELRGKIGLRNHSRRPNTSPNAIKTPTIKEIIKLRKQLRVGPKKISAYLLRKHDYYVSSKTIYKILRARGLNKLNKMKNF